MSCYRGNNDACPTCGLRYRNLNTGLTYQGVHDLLKDYSDDPRDWRYKRRNTVLGYWHSLKRMWWDRHLNECGDHPTHGDAYEDHDAWQRLDASPDPDVPF